MLQLYSFALDRYDFIPMNFYSQYLHFFYLFYYEQPMYYKNHKIHGYAIQRWTNGSDQMQGWKKNHLFQNLLLNDEIQLLIQEI